MAKSGKGKLKPLSKIKFNRLSSLPERIKAVFDALGLSALGEHGSHVDIQIRGALARGLDFENTVRFVRNSTAYQKAVGAQKAAIEQHEVNAAAKQAKKQASAHAIQFMDGNGIVAGTANLKKIKAEVERLFAENDDAEWVMAQLAETDPWKRRQEHIAAQQRKAEESKLQHIKDRQKRGEHVKTLARAHRLRAWGSFNPKMINAGPPRPVFLAEAMSRIDADIKERIHEAKRLQEVQDRINASRIKSEEGKRAAAEWATQREREREERISQLDNEVSLEEARAFVRKHIPHIQIIEFRRWFLNKYNGNQRQLMDGAKVWVAEHQPPAMPDPVIAPVEAPRPAAKPAPVAAAVKQATPHADVKISASGSVREVFQRDAAAQAQFRKLVLENFGERCAVTGKRLNGVLEAAHIEGAVVEGCYNASNGILLAPTFHKLYDRHMMGINPETMTVHFSPGIEWEEYEGKVITPLLYALDKERLAARWEQFKGSNK